MGIAYISIHTMSDGLFLFLWGETISVFNDYYILHNIYEFTEDKVDVSLIHFY